MAAQKSSSDKQKNQKKKFKMKKLWMKETNCSDAVFVDILNQNYYHDLHTKRFLSGENFEEIMNNVFKSCITKTQSQKNNVVAVQCRNTGNLLFAREKYREAMECYNKSLCLSTIGSDNISLAYANRSSCFYQMKMFDECLIDIDLAIKAGYPANKMEKLKMRRIDAVNMSIKNGELFHVHKPKLSFQPNDSIPELADAIQIKNDPIEGQRFIAVKNISVGQTIYLEPCFVGEAYVAKYLTCNICLENNKNLVPCGKCMMAMFCMNDKCQNSILHKFECGIKQCPLVTHSAEPNYLLPTIRSILLAVQMFPNVDALMEFVEESLANRSPDIHNFNDPKSKYRAFLNIKTKKFQRDDAVMIKMYHTKMMEKPEIAKIFNGKKYERFLMHLIAQHVLILQGGNAIIRTKFVYASEEYRANHKNIVIEMQMTILKASFKYSCAPHMIYVLDNGAIKGIVIRPLNKGEELTANPFVFLMANDADRQKFLLESFGKSCKCQQCKSFSELYPQNPTIRADPALLNILRSLKSPTAIYRSQFSDEEAEILKAKCVSFLTKYGRLRWSEEIDSVVKIYRTLLAYCDFTEDSPLYDHLH